MTFLFIPTIVRYYFVYYSNEYPTTMLPVLTTTREAPIKDSPFDIVPVNIIREDSKDNYARFSDANFGDLSDVSLVPAGTNSRIQVYYLNMR